MAKKTYTFKVNFNLVRDIGGFLDMLRYDRAIVLTWTNLDNGRMLVTLQTDNPPTIGRWNSFAIAVIPAY